MKTKFRIFDKELKAFTEEPDWRWMISCSGNLYNSENDEWHKTNDRFEIVLFTGLKDKNEKEIYEGDILSDKWRCKVYKDENTGAFMVKFKDSDINKNRTLYEYLRRRLKAGTAEECNRVIGNIYKNPELLKLN